MMSSSDADRLLDENFIALDESNPFDPLDNNGFGDVKFRKKSGFNFSSTWRSPKIGRRKSKSTMRKNTFNDDFTRGKFVKGRESFESSASIPLSEFDEARDMLPFLNLRNDTLNTKKSTKEKTAFNPKMFLSPPPVNRTEIKNKFKKERAMAQKVEKEELDDVFKPIHNNSDKLFDAFQILPKESTVKVTFKEETKPKQKEEEPEDQCDKENHSSFYGGEDHGPILSSLSEDTSLHSDSIRGVDFLEDEPKWNPLLNPNFEEEEEKTWFDMTDGKGVQKVESVKPNGKVETAVGSFSERMRLFQSKDTRSVISNSTKSSASSKISDILGPKVTNKKEKATLTTEKSEEEIDAELENLDKLVASVFPESGDKATEEPNQSNSVTSKSSAKPYSNKFERNFERIKTYQMNTESRVSTSSFQENKKKFGANKLGDDQRKKILVQTSEKVQSSVVDLSMIGSLRTQATSAPEPVIQKPSLSSNEEKIEPKKTWKTSEHQKIEPKKTWKKSNTSYERPRKSDWSVHSSYSHHTNYRSSISSQNTTSTFQSHKFGGHTLKPLESQRKPSMENDAKISRSSGASQSVEKVNLDEQDDTSVPVSSKTPTALEAKEKPRDLFLAAAALFGGKVEPSTNKFGRKFGTNYSKSSSVKAIEEKKEATESNNTQNVESSGQEKPVVAKKFDFGAKKSIDSLKSIESSTSKADVEVKTLLPNKVTTMPSVTKKPSLVSEPHNVKLGHTKTWLKTDSSTVDTPVMAPSESEDKVDAKPVASNESTASTSISSLTCDSAVPKNFAQQSASIFGVTLKKRRTESAPAPKETGARKKSIESVVNAEKSESFSEDTQTIKPVQDLVEKKAPENEEQKFNGGRTSTSSMSIQSFDKKPETEVVPANQEETSVVVEEQVKMSEKQPINLPQEETKFDEPVQKVNPLSLPRQTSSRSISNRLKMFEKATARNRKSYIRQDSPKSVGTSESSTLMDDLSVATKRRETSGSDFSIATQRRDTSESGITTVTGDEVNDLSDRRETLKSSNGTKAEGSSLKLQSKSVEKSSNIMEKPVVLPITKSTNDSTSARKEESNAKPRETLSKEDAYSMRRKFFENLDRKRMQASMSRPLAKEEESIQAKSVVAQETETVTDEPPHEDTDLPMFVEVEEDFMLKDNISTCLSASESRSVVCKPDALLYSVSQKAIAMMSVKAESSSMRSYTRTYGAQDKGTIDHGIKLNREESFRNRFSNKLAANNGKQVAETSEAPTAPSTEERPAEASTSATINDVQDDSEKAAEIPANDDDKKKEESAGISSLSIRERRKLFESKFGNGSANTSSISLMSRSSGLNDGSKSRPNDVPETTPLAGEPIASQLESTDSEAQEAPRNRTSSTSMSTLEYSLQSSSYSRPSDSSKRVSSASSSANQPSAAQLYRNALSSANRTSNHGRKNADLRCF